MDLVTTVVLGILAGLAVYGFDILRRVVITRPSGGGPGVDLRAVAWVGIGFAVACLITWIWTEMSGLANVHSLSSRQRLLGIVWLVSLGIGGLTGARISYRMTRTRPWTR